MKIAIRWINAFQYHGALSVEVNLAPVVDTFAKDIQEASTEKALSRQIYNFMKSEFFLEELTRKWRFVPVSENSSLYSDNTPQQSVSTLCEFLDKESTKTITTIFKHEAKNHETTLQEVYCGEQGEQDTPHLLVVILHDDKGNSMLKRSLTVLKNKKN